MTHWCRLGDQVVTNGLKQVLFFVPARDCQGWENQHDPCGYGWWPIIDPSPPKSCKSPCDGDQTSESKFLACHRWCLGRCSFSLEMATPDGVSCSNTGTLWNIVINHAIWESLPFRDNEKNMRQLPGSVSFSTFVSSFCIFFGSIVRPSTGDIYPLPFRTTSRDLCQVLQYSWPSFSCWRPFVCWSLASNILTARVATS